LSSSDGIGHAEFDEIRHAEFDGIGHAKFDGTDLAEFHEIIHLLCPKTDENFVQK
jgi:hypothetical protein